MAAATARSCAPHEVRAQRRADRKGMQTMRRNKSGLPKYCGWNIERKDGRRRVRFRHGGFSIYLTGTPWSEEFMRQYAAALDGIAVQPSNIGVERTKAGTINPLIVSYYTLVFPTIEPSTQ